MILMVLEGDVSRIMGEVVVGLEILWGIALAKAVRVLGM